MQRRHESFVERLVQRVLRHQGVQEADEFVVAAQSEAGGDHHLDALQAQLFEPGDEPADDPALPHSAERRATPLGESRLEAGHGLRVFLAPDEVPPFTEEPLEDMEVQLVGAEVQQVAGGSSDNGAVSRPAAPQEIAQLRNVHMQGGGGAAGRIIDPQLVHQLIHRQHLPRPDQQRGQQRFFLPRTQRVATAYRTTRNDPRSSYLTLSPSSFGFTERLADRSQRAEMTALRLAGRPLEQQ